MPVLSQLLTDRQSSCRVGWRGKGCLVVQQHVTYVAVARHAKSLQLSAATVIVMAVYDGYDHFGTAEPWPLSQLATKHFGSLFVEFRSVLPVTRMYVLPNP